MNRQSLLGCALLAVALAACGSSTPSPPRFSTGPVTPSASPTSLLDLTHATAAKPVATDTQVALSPKLYSDPGNLCAGVTTTSTVSQVELNCGVNYVQIVGTPIIAGSDVIANSGDPRHASVQAGITAADAIKMGNAFFVTDTIRDWAITLDQGKIIPTLDGVGTGSDALYTAVTAKPLKFADIQPCVYPSSIRVVTVDYATQQYIQGLGWQQPSTSAVVATYTKCPGIELTFTDGTKTAVLGHDQPVSVVITGRVATTAPFGPMWIEDGWAPCLPLDVLKNACA